MSKVLLITGGSRGIGAAVARLAAAEGYVVGLNYRERDDAAAALVAEITAAGGTARAVQADVAREMDVERLFAEVENELGQLAALVNSAGVGGQHAPVADFSGARLTRLMAVNVVGTMLCCREAARRMSTGRGGAGGAIVNVSSMAATVGGRPGSSDYAASKAAVDSFTVGFCEGSGARGHSSQFAASRDDADRYDGLSRNRSGQGRLNRLDHSDAPDRQCGRDRPADPVALVRCGILHHRRLYRRFRRRLRLVQFFGRWRLMRAPARERFQQVRWPIILETTLRAESNAARQRNWFKATGG